MSDWLSRHPGIWATLRVIVGRGTARGSVQLSTVALLPAWGADEFGPFVAAIGTFGWLIHLVCGAEKAGLTVLPRTKVLRDQYTRMLLARAAAPLAIASAVTVVLLPVAARPALYGAAAALAAGQALLSVLASMHRLAGHPGRDSVAHLAFAGWVVAVGVLAVVQVLDGLGYLMALVAGLIVDCAVLAVAIPAVRRRPARPRRSRRLTIAVNRRVLLLGLSDVADAACVAVLYIVLAVAATPAATATVYLVLLVSSLLGAFFVLSLRLAQPRISLRLRGPGGADGRWRARLISARAVMVAGGALGVAVAGILLTYLVGGPSAVSAIGANPLLAGAAAVVEMTVFCVVIYAVFLLENTNGVALSTTSAAAIAGLAATAVTAAALVPALHVAGALLALVAGLTAKAGFLRRKLADVTAAVPERATSGAVVETG